MGIMAIGAVIFFSAYELTTYQSVRDALGGIAAQPSQVVGLHVQYAAMADQFANGGADSYTFHYGGQSIPIAASQATGRTEGQVLGLVLDRYAASFYSGSASGVLAPVAGIVGAGANGAYFLAAALLLAAFIAILGLSAAQRWYGTWKDMLKSAGKVLIIMGAIAFVAFLFLPAVAKSVMWASISGDLGREVVYVIEPRITGTVMVNALIVVLFGALLYGAGFFLHINTGDEEPDAIGYIRGPPQMRSIKPSEKADKKSPPPASARHRQL